MSSILKALKKLDEEKAARRSGQVDISRAILSEKAPHAHRRSRLLAIGGALLLTAALLSGGVSLWRGRSTPESASLQAKAPLLPTQPARKAGLPLSQPAASPSVPAPSPPPPRKATTAVRTLSPLPVQREQSPRRTSLVTPRETPSAPPSKPMPVTTPALQVPAETTARPVATQPSPNAHAFPTLRVSGIAWQKDSASRLAIVNGQPVGLGTAVDGASVEEIFQDRVRFAYKGEKVEVGLGKSSKGE